MSDLQRGRERTIRNAGQDRVVVFLHGFSGNRDDTWDRFPGLLGMEVTDWDIYTLGYSTTFLPDITGVWAADPDITIIATAVRTSLALPPFKDYRQFVLVAHSMGGLVAQKAIIDDDALRNRVSGMILYGTPSGGLKKAGWVKFWKQQLDNMAEGGKFICDLRAAWSEKVGEHPPFRFMTVAGEKDQFVPPSSSLEPFPEEFRQVVPGDHLGMVKPAAFFRECETADRVAQWEAVGRGRAESRQASRVAALHRRDLASWVGGTHCRPARSCTKRKGIGSDGLGQCRSRA